MKTEGGHQTAAPDRDTRVSTDSKLVLFDFDGTITEKDTLLEFVRFYHGHRRYYFGLVMLAPIIALYLTRLLPNWKAKQYFLSHYFKGETITLFNSRCLRFASEVLPSLIRPRALAAIHEYRGQQATVAVVSASAENWVKPWCDQYGIVCLATKLEVKEGVLSGKIKGRNCYGDEKVCRIREHFTVSDYHEVVAYGDSPGDKEMLALAHQGFYKPFRQNSLQ